MSATIIISLIVVVILFFVYREYRNEKKYQETRKEKKHTRKNVVTPSVKKTSSDLTPKPKPAVKKKTKVSTVEPEPTPKKNRLEVITEKEIELPSCQYPKFSYERLVGMGFSEAEALEYVTELIAQIETEIPLLEEAIKNKDFEKIEQITHNIKGSSSTIGSGGISDLINDLYFYVQTGKEQEVVQAYFKHLKKYYTDLKSQYQD